ncbi:MAG: hypothetical protein VB078_09045 [Clostridiaceae bacterium]|nr:hypothetical protein [Clostridiaceae bacterium]
MRKQVVTFDKNASLSNLLGNVIVSNSIAFGSIQFVNNTNKEIIAVKFNIRGYNSFGETVLINDCPAFQVMVQDLHVIPFSYSKQISVQLPSLEIRRIDVFEYQTCFNDSTIITYSGKDEVGCELLLLENNILADNEIANAYSLRSFQVNNYPAEINSDWVCCCGTFNSNEQCKKCGKSKTEVFKLVTPNNAVQIVDEQKSINKKNKSKKREKKVILSIVVAFLLMSITTVFYFSSHVVYFSDEVMIEDIQGNWTKYNSNGDAVSQILISGSSFSYNDWNGKSLNDKIECNPLRGEFTTPSNSYKYKMEKNGRIFCKDEMVAQFDYRKGGSPLVVKKNDYEPFPTALKLTKGILYQDGIYTKSDVTITNNGEKTYHDIYVTGFFTSDGKPKGYSISEFVCEDSVLKPGESITITVSSICSDTNYCDVVILSAYND